jgi:hypothetical protein
LIAVKALAVFLLILGSSSASLGGFLLLALLPAGSSFALDNSDNSKNLVSLGLPDFSTAAAPISRMANSLPECADSNTANCNYLNFRPAKAELQTAANTIRDIGSGLNQLVDGAKANLDNLAPQFLALKSVAYGVVGWTIITGSSLLASGLTLLLVSRRLESYQIQQQHPHNNNNNSLNNSGSSQSRTGAA